MKQNRPYLQFLFICMLMLLIPVMGFSQVNMGGKRKIKKKNGINTKMINKKKPPSVAIAEEYDDQNKHFDNPKKQAKIAEKQRQKKINEAEKRRRKANKQMLKKRGKLKKGKKKKNQGGGNSEG